MTASPPLASALVAPLLDRRHDSAPALRAGTQTWSYADLVAEILTTRDALTRAGIGPGSRVAIALPKSAAALRLILATLAAGAAYVPLNARLSPAHLATILADLAPDLLVAPPATLAALSVPGLRLTPDPTTTIETRPGTAETHPSPDTLAAILFTSGSTGAPKGIMLSHDNIFRFADWAHREFDLRAAYRVASHAPFHFDLSTFDIFSTLAAGACLHLIDEADTAFPGAVRRTLADGQITTLYCVPTALTQLQSRGALAGLPALRTILFAGEVFPTPALRAAMADLPHARFANLFGPTETNVCTFHSLPAPPADDLAPIPIGIPLPHAGITLEDGEICVTGPGVMLGYWRRPDLTAATRLPGRPDSYRTGDTAIRRPDGVLLFTGRKDQQIKLRGHRVELLGLESVLNAHPAVREAIAVARDDRLTVFLEPRTEPADERTMRNHIAASLAPSYQPAKIIWLNPLPRSPTGKADRSALAARI